MKFVGIQSEKERGRYKIRSGEIERKGDSEREIKKKGNREG